MTVLDGIMAGTDCWLSNGNGSVDFTPYRNDPTVVNAMRGATKRILYITANYNDIMNGMDENATVRNIMPWWQILLTAAIVVSSVLTVASLALYVAGEIYRKKKQVAE